MRMRTLFSSLLMLLVGNSVAVAQCNKEPLDYPSSVVAMWHDALEDGNGPVGSAVIVRKDLLITTEGVADAMVLGMAPQFVEFQEGEFVLEEVERVKITLIKVLKQSRGAKIYLFKLERPLSDVQPVRVREKLPMPHESVMAAGYKTWLPRIARGRIRAQSGKIAIAEDGLLRFDADPSVMSGMFSRSTRGGGLFDCQRRLVGLIAGVKQEHHPDGDHVRLRVLPVRDVLEEIGRR